MTAHIRYDKPDSIVTSDEEWFDATAQVGREARTRTHRNDITAVVSATCGHGAPACYIPSRAELHLNHSLVPMGDPAKFDLSDRLWRLEHAAAVGALWHETAHARWTKWDFDAFTEAGANKRMMDVIVTLEEPRIEYNAIEADAGARVFLRGCAMEIVAKDFKISSTPYGAAAAAGLLLARVDAGVLSKAEGAAFWDLIEDVLGEDTLLTLRGLWRRFLRLRDTDYAGMVQVAREWLEALDLDPDADEDEDDHSDLVAGAVFGEGEPEDGEGDSESESGGSGDEDGEGEGSGDGDAEKPAEGDLSDRITARARQVAVKADDEVTERRGAEREARAKAERQADAERHKASEKAHEKAFPPRSSGYSTHVGSHLLGVREPTADERAAAKALSKTLAELHFHDRHVTKTLSEVPPGRLRGGAAVGNAAARSKGLRGDAPIWAGKKRRVVDTTPLSVAILVDISGSMGHAMAPLASTQWVLSAAGSQIDANLTTVHFGARVHGVLRAGVREKQVRTFRANDGHEAFQAAALAADREVNLLDGRGARLLVVLSDGDYVNAPDRAYATSFVPLAIRKGVAVLHLSFGYFESSYGATHVNAYGLAPTQVAMLVGKAAAQEMRRADKGL